MKLGDMIAELRIDNGLKQKQLAEILNVSPGTVSNYENEVYYPDVEKIVQLADLFHVTTDYLLGRTDNNISPELLNKRIADGKPIAKYIHILQTLPEDRQRAVMAILEDMDFRRDIELKKYGE